MPLLSEIADEHGGYGLVIDNAFATLLKSTEKHVGGLAVIYDKNKMEASGYAAVMADAMNEHVYLVEYYNAERDPNVKWIDGLMYVRDNLRGKTRVSCFLLTNAIEWHPIRACFRYVTQKPWNRIPLVTKTVVLNGVIACLSGGRNKLMAARAYEFLNAELDGTGISVRVPETIRNVAKNEIPLWLDSMGGHAVLKVPYSNAGNSISYSHSFLICIRTRCIYNYKQE